MASVVEDTRARTLSLVFTDLADSTSLKTEMGDHAASALIARHREHVQRFAGEHNGRIIDWAGDGCFAVFENPSAAVLFALRLQQAHAAESDLPAVRVGIHLGEVSESTTPEGAPRVEGLAVDVAARIQSLATPGQVLLSVSAFDNARQRLRGDDLGAPIAWRAHGPYLLKGVDDPLEVAEAGLEGLSPLTAPEDSDKGRRAVHDADEETLGWRPAVGLTIPYRNNWVLSEQLGEGGFGEVWKANHAKTHETRVFKFCFQANRLRALRREVVLFRLLKETLGTRDDIARVLDWQFDQAPYYLESEYTPGGDFVEWALAQGGLDKTPLATRLELVAQAAEALGAAHSVGVLHKDVKPRNILVSEDAKDEPCARLTDFGIGALLNPEALAEQGITAIGLTETLSANSDSSGAGTRMFMAPELVEGKQPTTLSDIYALGVILYQAVVGDFHQSVAPGWERDIDDELLREDIAQCVDRDPTRRLQSANDLAERLRTLDVRREEREASRRAALDLERAKRRRRTFLVASTIGSLLTIATIGIAINENRRSHTLDRLRSDAVSEKDNAVSARRDAEAARDDAEVARAEAERERTRAERSEYRANILKAIAVIDQQGPSAARDTLRSIPEEHRGWEWGFLADRAWPWIRPESDAPPKRFSPGATTAEMWDQAAARTLYSHNLNGFEQYLDANENLLVSQGPEIRLWNPDSNEVLYELTVDSHGWARVSPDGRYIARNVGEAMTVWNARTGEPSFRTDAHGHSVTSFEMSPDGRYLVTATWDGMIRIWDLDTGSETANIPLNFSPWLMPIRFSPDSQSMSVPSGVWTVKTYSLPDGREIASHTSKDATGVVLDISPNLEKVLSRGDGKVRDYIVWDLASGETLCRIDQRSVQGAMPWHERNSHRFSPDGTCVAVWSEDNTIEIWDANKGRPLTQISSVPGFRAFVFFDDGTVGLTRSDRTFSRLAPAAIPPGEPNVLRGHESAVINVGYSHSGDRLITASYDGTAIVWNAKTREQIAVLKGHTGKVVDAQFSPDDSIVLTIGWDTTSRIWDAATGELRHTISRGVPEPKSIGGPFSLDSMENTANSSLDRFSPEGTHVVVPMNDAEGAIVDAETGETVLELLGPDLQGAESATFTKNGRYIMTSVRMGYTCVWDRSTGELLHRFGEAKEHWGVLSPDDEHVLVIFGSAALYDIETGEKVWDLESMPGGEHANGVAFSHDGSKILCGLTNHHAAVLDARTGATLNYWRAHLESVTSARPGANPARILTKGQMNTVRLWDWDSQQLFTMNGNGIPIDVAWSPDGRQVVIARFASTSPSMNSVELWESIPWNELIEIGDDETDLGLRISEWRDRRTR